jgi:Predicted integral membrane protein
MKIDLTNKAVIASAVGAAMIAYAGGAAAGGEREKCYGVAKAGKNDCSNLAGTHSCAGQSEVDGDVGEWLLVPKGLCEKLVGGMNREAAKAKAKEG